MEPPSGVERGVDEGFRNAVVDDEVKADVLERVAQRGAEHLRRARVAPQQRSEVENRNALGRIGRIGAMLGA